MAKSDDFEEFSAEEFFQTNPEGFEGEGLRPVSFVLAEALALLQAWEDGDLAGGFPTSLYGLDQFIRLSPEELTIIGARPGMGKTALSMQIAASAVRNPSGRDRVAVFSAEMSGKMLLMRMACASADVRMSSLRSRDVASLEYRKVREALRMLENLPIWIADRSAPDFGYMYEQLREMQESYNLVGVVFDFIELLKTDGRATEERASKAVLGLKDIAKTFSVPVIGISHLNREVEERTDKLPRLSDLRSSGMIEQIADQVLLLLRPKYYRDKGIALDLKSLEKDLGSTNVEDICYVVVAKNRNGTTGIARIAYDGQRMRFYDVERRPLVDESELQDDPDD